LVKLLALTLMEKNIDRTDTGGRSGFEIHPDGGKTGTKGCIGLTQNNTKPIYQELKDYIIKFKFLFLSVDY